MLSRRRVFVLLYTASGAAALIYEVAWTRLLTLQLGHTVAAASTVLAAFMGGLALGAWLAGRFSLGTLRTYALLEVVVAATALVLPVALDASVPALAWAYADGAAPTRFTIVRVVISLALLGVPAAAMGATFPIAANWHTDAALLYAANTSGAALGAIAAGFWLIPALGLRGTTWIGVLLNGLAAGGALWIASRQTTVDAEPAKRQEPAPKIPFKPKTRNPSALSPPAPALPCAAAAISGLAALVYEAASDR